MMSPSRTIPSDFYRCMSENTIHTQLPSTVRTPRDPYRTVLDSGHVYVHTRNVKFRFKNKEQTLSVCSHAATETHSQLFIVKKTTMTMTMYSKSYHKHILKIFN
eukprot:COSAG02_NODE_2002_length_10139_cov_4.784761_9_plen_104_part_00